MPDNFEIAYPWVFLLLPLPFVVYRLVPPLRLRSASLFLPTYQKAVGYTGEKPRRSAMVKRRNALVWSILFLGWTLFLSTLSGPQLVGEPEKKVKTSRNFLIAADISFSMAKNDWMVNGRYERRWDGVKSVLHDFIKKREGDRMGLIFFGTNAYIQAPFTPDLGVVGQTLDEADVGMAGQMTHLGKAIAKGIGMFDKDTIKTKVMLLLTDGVDAGDDVLPYDAADLARKDTVKIYTIGMGSPGNSGSDLDEQTLKEIAEMTNGQYFRASDQKRLAEIYTELDKLEPIEYEEEHNRPVTLLYRYPLTVVVLLLLILFMVQVAVMAVKRTLNQKETDFV